MSLTVERILADAEIAATYFRALCDKGVPAMAAVSLTSSYVSGHIISRGANEEPRKPWEPDA